MTCQSCDGDEVFRLFTLPPEDMHKQYLLLDVRDHKEFKKAHIAQSFNVKMSGSGTSLVDLTHAKYNLRWAAGIWHGRTVYVYGLEGLKKDHEVIKYLVSEGCTVKYMKEGLPAFQKAYPALVSASIKAGSFKQYPSQVLPGLLYLGDWKHAEDIERLQELNVRNIVTIHNHPENLKGKLAKGTKWLKWELPDVDTVDITPCFSDTYAFIEEARSRKEAVLVHCGAGVSRSATLCMMYLMRRFSWSAQKAKNHCVERRPVVCPNDGFWRTLCALEATLGISVRSDPNATTGFHGNDAPPDVPSLGHEVVGGKVPVLTLSKEQLKRKRDRDDDETRAPKQARTGSGVTATIEMRKPAPEGVVAEMIVGPIGPHQRVMFGRLPSNDIVCEHASISRQHAALSSDLTGALLLTDLASGHGTKLDGTWVRANTAKQLRVGSVFSFGASTRQYHIKDISKG